MLRFRSIFLKLLATYLILLVLSFFIFSVVSYVLFHKNLAGHQKALMLDHERHAADFVEKAYAKGWNTNMVRASLALSAGPMETYYFYDKSGKLLYTAGKGDALVRIDSPLIRQALTGDSSVVERQNDGRLMFYACMALHGPEAMKEKAVILAAYGFTRDFNRLRSIFLIGIFISIMLSAVVIFYLSTRMARPLKQMNKVALQIADGNFGTPIQVRGRDEIGQLADSLNYMAKELQGLENSRRDFLANVSHDLRTPLTSIRGFVEALLDGAVPAESRRSVLLKMRDATERLIKLVEDLLDMARMQSGQVNIRPTVYNLSERVRSAIAALEPNFAKKDLEVELVSLGPKGDYYVMADPDRIDQVLINLLQNAIQFSPAGGRVEVRIERKDRTWITVRDSGPGIRSEDLPYVFERFYKADKARSQSSGIGIGLSIVKHIIDLHRTGISVETKHGKGTSFIFSLPNA